MPCVCVFILVFIPMQKVGKWISNHIWMWLLKNKQLRFLKVALMRSPGDTSPLPIGLQMYIAVVELKYKGAQNGTWVNALSYSRPLTARNGLIVTVLNMHARLPNISSSSYYHIVLSCSEASQSEVRRHTETPLHITHWISFVPFVLFLI